MFVPYVDLAQQNSMLKEEILSAVAEVLDHGQLINGPEVGLFEARMAEWLGVNHVIGVNSGTDALILAMRALGIGPGDEVITTSHTYCATVSAIMMVGANPVLVDIQPDSMLISPEEVLRALTPRTRAIIAVHLNGTPCELDALVAICDEHALHLLEDSAQSMGASYKGQKVGTFGTGCFSLHPLKTLAACGDAGFITTSSHELAERLKRLRSIGHRDRDHVTDVSGNSRLDTLQAAILLAKMRHLDLWIDKRRENAGVYDQELGRLIDRAPHVEHVAAVPCPYVFQTDRRDELLQHLQAKGIDAKIHYPVPTHSQEAFASLPKFDLTNTERVVKRIISLPCSPELEVEERADIIKTIRGFFER